MALVAGIENPTSTLIVRRGPSNSSKEKNSLNRTGESQQVLGKSAKNIPIIKVILIIPQFSMFMHRVWSYSTTGERASSVYRVQH